MKKIFLIIQREFMSRVKKRSFLLATILVPLIFPAIIGGMIYVKTSSDENKEQDVIQVFNEGDLISFEDSKEYKYVAVDGPLDSAKANFNRSEDFALIYVPEIDVGSPVGIAFYAKTSPGLTLVRDFERNVERQIREIKLTRSGFTEEQLDELETDVDISSFNISETGDEKQSDANSTFWVSYVMGFLIYIFLFAYGSQVMQGVIEEKNSKIVEVVVSTVRPFHMMIGKVVGVASVGLVQFIIWIVLMNVIVMGVLAYFGIDMDPNAASQIAAQGEAAPRDGARKPEGSDARVLAGTSLQSAW